MTREEKIKVIYRELANCEFSFGCRVIIDGEELIVSWVDEYFSREWFNESRLINLNFSRDEKPTIVWHPVMIWDVISYLRKPFNTFIEGIPVGINLEVDSYIKNINSLLTEWIDARLPIEQQSDECVNFIYSLIKNV